MTTNPMPKAKTERLIVREIDSETLVYDRGRNAASCLNESAARVWRECDGETSVDEIADAARVTKGAVYHHFAGKEALFRAVYDEAEADAYGRAVVAGDPEDPPIDQLVAKVNAYLDAVLDQEIRRITLIDGPAGLGHEPDPSAEQQANAEAVRLFIATAIEHGQLADLNPGVLTDLIGGLAWLGALLIARASDPGVTRAELGKALDVMLRGLAPGKEQ